MSMKLVLIRLIPAIILAVLTPFLMVFAFGLFGELQLTGEMSSLNTTTVAIAAVVSLVIISLAQWLPSLIAEIPEDEAANQEEGTVKWFNNSKGFGFITRDNGEDVFVHFRALRTRSRHLQEGQKVRFNVVESAKGLQADNVVPIRSRA